MHEQVNRQVGIGVTSTLLGSSLTGMVGVVNCDGLTNRLALRPPFSFPLYLDSDMPTDRSVLFVTTWVQKSPRSHDEEHNISVCLGGKRRVCLWNTSIQF